MNKFERIEFTIIKMLILTKDLNCIILGTMLFNIIHYYYRKKWDEKKNFVHIATRELGLKVLVFYVLLATLQKQFFKGMHLQNYYAPKFGSS